MQLYPLRLRVLVIEIAQPGEEHRDQIAEVMSISLNFGRDWVERRTSKFRLEQFLCAFDGGRLVATAAARPFLQWFGGRPVPMTGIYAVATLPEHRGTGLASELVTQLIRRGREDGAVISSLYPAALRPYRSIGYELAGTYTDHRISIADLPAGKTLLTVEEYTDEDLEGVRACFRRVAETQNGLISSELEDWWTERILRHSDPSVLSRVVVVRGPEGVEGYCPFHYGSATGEHRISFGIETSHLVARSEAGLRSLLSYFRGFRGLGETLTWSGPPADPISLIVEEQRVKSVWTFRWMLRLLDTPRALEARGYPPVSGGAEITLSDPSFEDNDGVTFRIEADAGRVRAAASDAAARPAIASIGTFSSMFTGFLSPADAARIGVLEADQSTVAFLSSLLAGPPPWLPEWF